MNDEKSGRRPDEPRNVAVASILEVTSEFMYVDDLDTLLKTTAKTVSETFGLAKVHIGIREEGTGLFAIRAAHGFDRAAGTEPVCRVAVQTLEGGLQDAQQVLLDKQVGCGGLLDVA